jgi:hypothetical protein
MPAPVEAQEAAMTDPMTDELTGQTTGEPDPFVVMLARRDDAAARCAEHPQWAAERRVGVLTKARLRAVQELLAAVRPRLTRGANFGTGPDWALREDAFAEAWLKVSRFAELVYDGQTDPPASWTGWIHTVGVNAGRTTLRKHERSGVIEVPESVRIRVRTADPTCAADRDSAFGERQRAVIGADVAVVAGDRAERRWAAVGRLRERYRAFAEAPVGLGPCVFHSGAPCAHAGAGAPPGACPHLEVVLAVVEEVEWTGDAVTEVARRAADRLVAAGSSRPVVGRDLVRCVHWMRYLAFARLPDLEPRERLGLVEGVLTALAHSATTSDTPFCRLEQDRQWQRDLAVANLHRHAIGHRQAVLRPAHVRAVTR